MKIALIYDCNGWAWHYMAVAIQKYAPPKYQVDIFCSGYFSDHMVSQYDAILYFSWSEAPTLPIREVVVAAHMGMTLEPGKLGTTKLRNAPSAAWRLPMFSGIICVNRKLEEFCRQIVPATYIPAGVDLDVFMPRHEPDPDEPIRIGWCGQLGTEHKGYRLVLCPLMQEFPQFEWSVNMRTAGDPLSQSEMTQWYQTLDLFLCTSAHEGTPMPPLEAAASGVPVLTTDVGDMDQFAQFMQVPAWHDEQSAANTVRELASSLEWLANNGSSSAKRRLYGLGELCRREVERRADWRQLAPQWLDYVAGVGGTL